MIPALFWFSVGLIVGWNLFPQPVAVKVTYDFVVEWLKSKLQNR